MTLLHTAIVRARAEPSLAPEVMAELNSLLWMITYDAVGVNKWQRQEEGVVCLQAALQIYTYVRYPRQYARPQTNLGFVYAECIEGEQRVNLEQAIHCYVAAFE